MVKWGYTLVRTRQSVPLNPVLFITVNYARVLKKIGRGDDIWKKYSKPRFDLMKSISRLK